MSAGPLTCAICGAVPQGWYSLARRICDRPICIMAHREALELAGVNEDDAQRAAQHDAETCRYCGNEPVNGWYSRRHHVCANPECIADYRNDLEEARREDEDAAREFRESGYYDGVEYAAAEDD